jgi:hypothetical protein
MPSTEVRNLNFDASATLKKWRSINRERVGSQPYLIVDGTLDECIRKFMSIPAGQHHLYEIHTSPQPPLVTTIMSAIHIVAEIDRLRDFL